MKQLRDWVRVWSRRLFGDSSLFWELLTWVILLIVSYLVVFMAIIFVYAVTLALWNILLELARVR
jgi:hypothetical protein